MKILLALITSPELDVMDSHEYPLGLLSIAAYLRRHRKGWEIKIIAGNLTVGDVSAWAPDCIGISIQSPFFTMAHELIQEVHQRLPNVPIIIGGHHCTYIPACLPREATAGVIGEGEKRFLQLCDLFLNDGTLAHAGLSAINGIVYWKDDQLVQTRPAVDLLEPDEFPLIDTYALCRFKYQKPIRYHIMTSRGCPYRCRFCSSSPFWRKVRYQSPKGVCDQIRYLVDAFRPDLVHIFDDLMITNRERLKAIRDIIMAERINKRVAFCCWAAGAHFDEEVAGILREMNVVQLSFAVESASPRIYRYLKGSWNSPEKNERAIRLAARFGFRVDISVIVGSPEETEEEMQSTCDYIQKLPVAGGSVSLLKPYPGTVLWDEAKERGIVNDSMDDWHVVELNDLADPKTLFLAQKVSRETVLLYYRRIRELLRRKSDEYRWKYRLGLLRNPVALFKKVMQKW